MISRKRLGLVLLSVIALLFVASVYGQTSTETAAAPAAAPPQAAAVAPPQTAPPAEMLPVSEYPVLRTLGGLGLVVSLMVLGFFAARKFAPQFFNRKEGEQRMKVVEILSMGDKRSIALVQVEDQFFLVGNTTQQISLLAQLPLEFQAAKLNPVAETRDQFRKLYEVEKKPVAQRGTPKPIPAEVRAKMRQLREALEH